ncbi:hypothetical protein [Streptomyces omiyaensis]|uniref:Uncharacterized protein n=1 Tax=Streptomyces omiyaensis TaxID=68247 RepID=A0ABW7BXK0_9ACTN|nr:hypothetical protein [Streptomyces omiyaensis]GGY42736.1 hypothetical protein GCM10010363_24240 [Streptomyces omiyaensis]
MTYAEELPAEELTGLESALHAALNPLATALRARTTGQPEEHMWRGEPVDVALSVLAAWKVVDQEVKRLTAIAAGTAGSYGASYEQLGAVWGITRQGARKKWPDAVSRPAPGTLALDLFGGRAELTPAGGGWTWTATAADGTRSDATTAPTKEEAAALAGAFLKEHAR